MMKAKSIGFVLAALLIAAAIALVWIGVTGQETYTKVDETSAQLRFVMSPLDDYLKKHGRFPAQGEGLNALIAEQLLIPQAAIDTWKQPLVYRCQLPDCSKILIYSIGTNGLDEGGKGDDISIERVKPDTLK